MINKKCQSLQKKCNISTVIGDQDFIYRLKIYIEFRSFGGIFCGGILTLQETRFSGPGTTGRPLGGLDTLDQPKPQKEGAARKPGFWRENRVDVGFGLRFLRVFMGMVCFYRCSTVFLWVVAKLLHQKPGFVD